MEGVCDHKLDNYCPAVFRGALAHLLPLHPQISVEWALLITDTKQAFMHPNCFVCLYFFVRALPIPSHALCSCWLAITVNRHQSGDGATSGRRACQRVNSPSPDFLAVFLFYGEHPGHFAVCMFGAGFGGGQGVSLRETGMRQRGKTNAMRPQKYKGMSFRTRRKY